MARQPSPGGSWILVEELLDAGNPAFVDELRKLDDADRLGAFAARWYQDRRPAARRFLLEYLDRPLNAFRHEALVKRLFKLAEKAGDDEVMGRFLVALDRSVRRVIHKLQRYDYRTRESWEEETLRVPTGTTMPRREKALVQKPRTAAAQHLFSVATRKYLRRRAWRYFRRLGREKPQRYLPAVVELLQRYQDADVADGCALLDNWGLVHILYHHSPVLLAKHSGWTLTPGRALAELEPAPIFSRLWQAAPDALLTLLDQAQCRPVRQWTIAFLKRHLPDALSRVPLEKLVRWLTHPSPEMVTLAAGLLRTAPGLENLPAERWLALVQVPNPETLEVLCELLASRVRPEQVTIAQAAGLARQRPLPLARLGRDWLVTKQPHTEADCRILLELREAEAELLRPELVRWAGETLSASPLFRPEWLLEFLDCRHADVRAEGWAWFEREPRARQAVAIWQRLLESPHDDVRLPLLDHLDDQARTPAAVEAAELQPELVRFLWASVLLNIHRGNRTKPLVVRQIVRRLERKAGEVRELLPILSVALRSVRGPEFCAGLAGIVQLVERNPELEGLVTEMFPELQLRPA